ncbi:SusC/RagA family TonB-linked outer membrane protein [Salegentibacter salegens]|uniref:TonB-linked outer membrane protein, SusC/RagA family n=1 Tax=Salegentibacter salegens TaxID=143223 RepID=A0A1M7N8W0_9FLAO|nr:TonB-dependent receptor [Salegentibacter salegens]PRX45696.1 TonB-linked SusC/RagA family outer membrane protein [Salegentibacter salegens]SHM99931.1 TonB-linked outer membrane protein, SusC/RagA family [Salegentibacter salegens]
MKNNYLKRGLFIVTFFCFGFITAQQTVTGTVSDESGPIPGVNVIERGTSNGTTTDFDGNYSIEVSDDAVLVFSYISYQTQEIAVNDQSVIDVNLVAASESLDDVIVVGYGTQSRAEVTGAISSISTEEINSLPVSTAEQALQGRASGVTVINSGSPGNSPAVRIRGLASPNNNDPLYVIDGVIAGGLGSLNPNDIENIQVLKDASTTAVYGSRGANGVVLVTTKSGTASQKAQLSLDTYTGVQFNNNRYDLLNREQYIQYAREVTDTDPERLTNPEYADFIDNNTDWQDEIFRTGVMKSINLGLSGGNENSNFRFSGGYLNQEGAVIETEFERFNFRSNSNFNFGKLSFGQTLNVAFTLQNPEREDGGRSIIEHAIKSAPYLSVYNPDNRGGFQGPNSALDGQDAANPVRVQTLGSAENKGLTILGSLFAEYEIIDGLTFKSQAGIDYYKYNNNNFIPSYNDDSNGGTHQFGFAQITKNSGTNQSLTLTNSLNYKFEVADFHNFEVLVLAEDQTIDSESLDASSQNPITDDVEELSLNQAGLSSASSEYRRVGYLGRLNYNFDQKYLLSGSYRQDASSRFGANNRWGTFWSVSAGWNVAKESFMEDTDFNNFKIRGSWGTTGNDQIGNYRYASTLVTSFIYPIGGAAVQGTTAEGLPNQNLKWEEVTMKNIGLDLGMFNNALTLSLEYYSNQSDDLLYELPLPLSLGYNVPTIASNVGSVETTGFEADLGYNDYEGEFTWSANLNLGTSKNEVLSIGSLDQVQGGFFENEYLTRIAPGETLFHFYGLKTDGIYQNQAEVDEVFTANPDQTAVQPGDIRFQDLNGDGDITAADKTVIGNPYPTLTMGLNLSAQYKNFDISMFIQGAYGHEIYNTNLYDLEGMPRLFNSGVAVLNRWTGEGTSNTIPRALGAPQNLNASDRFVEDGSYTRLKNLNIGYTFDENIFGESLANLRIYISGQNLITLTDYSGLDPEIGVDNVLQQGAGAIGIDRGLYPQPTSLTFGLQLGF